MPKKTFENLDKEKKQAFIQVALAEFATHTYETASITQMVKKLDIAKGSVYQYFEHKKDLYFYLMQYVNEQKQQAMAAIFQQGFADFFEMFEKMYVAGTQFDLEHPLYSTFLYNVAQERHSSDLGDLYMLTKKQTMGYYKGLLQKEVEKGNIRQDMDLEIISFCIVQIGSGIYDYFKLKFTNTDDISTEEIENTIHQIIGFMKVGMVS
jgi:AcrR family transcriptional regulator